MGTIDMERAITLRPVTPEDMEFLYRLFVSARQDDFVLPGWTQQQRENLLRLQFQAQNAHYGSYCRDADFAVVLKCDQPIGRLYLERREGEIHIVDLALLPECRNQGVGTALLRGVLDEAATRRLRVTLQVALDNRAKNLYARLGFVQRSADDVYCQMEFP